MLMFDGATCTTVVEVIEVVDPPFLIVTNSGESVCSLSDIFGQLGFCACGSEPCDAEGRRDGRACVSELLVQNFPSKSLVNQEAKRLWTTTRFHCRKESHKFSGFLIANLSP